MRRVKSKALVSSGGWSEVETTDCLADTEDWLDEEGGERYQKDCRIGEGGMGVVYSAFDQRLGRQVALKQVADHLSPDATQSAEQRLSREAKVMAGLEHPGIIAIHDCGIDGAGQSYYVMRLFRGVSFRELLDANLSEENLGRLLRHFLDVCEAMAYAHQLGVAHGDLKPENIMAAEPGETQVVDWGLARHRSQPHREGATGTAGYMSPEQADGRGASATSDVYSLGEILNDIVTAQSHVPESRNPELTAIVDKCTAQSRTHRYSNASELAQEIRQYFDGQRVQAYTYSPWESTRRVVSAWRLPLTIAAIAGLVTLIAGVAFIQRIRSEKERAITAEKSARIALVARDQALGRRFTEQARYHFQLGNYADAAGLAVAALGYVESPVARGVLAALPSQSKRVEITRGVLLDECTRLLPTDTTSALCSESGRSRVLDWRSGETLFSVAGNVTAIASVGDRLAMVDSKDNVIVYSKGGERAGAFYLRNIQEMYPLGETEIVVRNYNDVVQIDLQTMKQRSEFQPCTDAIVDADLGGGYVATLCPNASLVVQPVKSPAQALRLELKVQPVSIAINESASLVAIGAANGTILVFAIRAEGIEPSGPGIVLSGQYSTLLWVGDTHWLVVIPEVGAISVWDTASGEELVRLPLSAGRNGQLAGKTLVTAGRRVQHWQLAANLPPLRWHSKSGLSSAAVSQSGEWLAAATGAGTLMLWNRVSGQSSEIKISDQVVKRVTFSNDERTLIVAVAGAPGMYRIDRRSHRIQALSQFPAMRRVLSTDSDTIVGIDYAEGLYFWTEGAGKRRHKEEHHYIDMDGRTRLVLLDDDGNVYRLQEKMMHKIAQIPGARAVAIDDQGTLVAVASEEELVLVADGKTTTLASHPGPYLDVAIGKNTITAGTQRGVVVIWDRETLKVVSSLRGHKERAAFVDYTPTGEIISAGWDGDVRFWDPSRLVD